MNSGWFTGLPSSSNGIHAKLRVVGIGSFFSNNFRTFNYQGDLRFTSQQVDEILNASGINQGIVPNYEEIKNENQ